MSFLDNSNNFIANGPKVINPHSKLIWGHDGQLEAFKREQYIPPELIDQNRADFEASKNRKSLEFERYASIPSVIYYKWMDEGYDPDEHTPEDVIAKLKRENLEYFITSSKIG